ncbi:uncharacterized protein LOC113374903 [Ctenocephalides felis]|uniref:uncharacterized protein LOC113374903 n=1 Tax=Ctenocephalides felis TaxID=7515 RepID=UPI000E6E3063|nr:uncharacterized protein LOC113374903 [Ctenocephalides felis]
MNNNNSGASDNRSMSALSLNNGSFRRSLGSTGSSVPNTPVLSIFSSTVIVNKDNAGYGMKVSGDKPVYVQSVKDGGAAQRAGLHSGDKIIKVNGVDVTHSTHTEVVALIKANAQVVLTVQQRVTCGDMCSTRNIQSATVTSPNNNTISSGRAGITAPRPVDNEKMRQLELHRIQTLRMMLEEEQKHLATLRSKPGKRQEIQRAEARVHTLQEQLKALDTEGSLALSPTNAAQSDNTTTSHFNPHFLSRFPRSLSNLSLGGRAKKNEKDDNNHEKCDIREGHASVVIDAPPPLPQRNKNMMDWLQEQTSVDNFTDLDLSIDDNTKQILNSFLEHERNPFVSDVNNTPPPLPPRQDRPLPNSIDTVMNHPLVSTCAPALCDNITNPALQTKSAKSGHKRTQSSSDPVVISPSNCAERQSKSSRGSWGHPEATPPGTPPPPYPSLTNADEEIADAWNFQFCNSITKSEDLHDRKGTLTNTSDSIQAAQSVTSQQHIISMEDEEVSDSETTVEEHGPFKSLRLLLEHPGHVAVFLNYLFTNAQPASLLFYLITDIYRDGNLKDMRRWAYEIHSTFLVPGAPLHLRNVDETMAREIDDVLLYESDKEEILRKIFLRARTKAKEELTAQLNHFQVTRTVGLGMMFGPNDISLDTAIGDRSKEIRVIEMALLSNLESYLEDLDSNKENVDYKRYATAQALATVLLRWFRISLNSQYLSSSVLERCPTFVSKEKTFRGKLIGKSRKLVVREHHLLFRQYYIVTHCNQCHDIIWGVGPQGYHCSDCGLNIHRGCSRVLEEDCPGPPVNTNSKSKQNQTDRRISKLMEKIRPNHHFINTEKQQRMQEEDTIEEFPGSNAADRPSSMLLSRNTSQRGNSLSTPEKGESADDSHCLIDEVQNENSKPKSAPVSVNRSESYKERLSQRRSMNQRRKTSDPNLSKTIDDSRDHNVSQASSTNSSTSSLSSRSLESPSISLEAVHGGSSASQAAGGLMLGSTSIDLQGGDSDESENRRDWTIQVPPEILGTLTDKDKNSKKLSTVSGDKPVYVQSVKTVAQHKEQVNGVDVTHSTHTEVVALIKSKKLLIWAYYYA